jgi:glycosyltransferase 2 family protein
MTTSPASGFTVRGTGHHAEHGSGYTDVLFGTTDSAYARLRRPADGVVVLLAALLLVVASVIASVIGSDQQAVIDAAATLFSWMGAAWRALYAGALGYALLVLVVAALTRRWRITRDILIALALVYAGGLLIGRTVMTSWPSLAEGIWSTSTHYPALRLGGMVAVLTVAGAELTRSARVLAFWLAALAGAAAVVLGIGYPASILGGLALGTAAAGIVRLAFGSTAGFPPAGRVGAALTELDVDVTSLSVSPRQRAGTATYLATAADGTALRVVVLGRDAQDTQRLANHWRNLAYRDTGPDLAVGRLQQVEHESLITLWAARAGVTVPRVRVAGVVDSGDAVIVLDQPDLSPVETSDTDMSDEVLTALWREVATLRSERVSHGALNLSHVITARNRPIIIDFNRGRLAASDDLLNVDLAEMLVATSIAAGSNRALTAALAAMGPEAIAAALPFLQRAALTPHLRDLAHGHELDLQELRTTAAAATDTELPDIAPLRRFKWRDLATTVLVVVAAYVTISKLAQIGLGTIWSELRQAEPAWVVVALLVAQLNYVTHAISLRGAVMTPLPMLPCVVLQSAIKFINLTVPSSAGRIAISIRFLQRLGVPTPDAVAAGAVDGVGGTIVQIVLVLLILPFVSIDVDLPSSDNSSTPHVLLILLAVSVVVAAAILINPKWRSKVVPNVRRAISSIGQIARTRSKRLALFGGNVATQIVYALTLGAACHAYGADLTLGPLLLVNMGATMFASVIPVPGGIGVAEAGITAGLSAFGVPHSVAFAAALTHRLCTYYLPPLWGYLALRWLTRKGYV